MEKISGNKYRGKILSLNDSIFNQWYDSFPDIILIHTPFKDGREKILAVNQIACHRYGYTREEFIRLTLADITEECPKISETLKKQLNQGQPVLFETRHFGKTKTILPLEISATIIRFNDQKAILSVCRDISKHMQHHDFLKQAKETAEHHLNISAEIILALDSQGRITMLNDSGHRLLGYGEGELIGKNWFETCLPPSVRDEIRGVFEQLMNGETQKVGSYENPVVTKDGQIKIIHWQNSLLRNGSGHITGTLSSGEDITDRQKIEDALRRKEKMLNDAQRIARIGSWEFDLTRNELFWSDEVYRMFELPKEQFKGTYEAFLQTVHPDDRQTVDRMYRESVRNHTHYKVEHRLLLPDGRIKWMQEQCETYYDNSGKPLRSVGTVLDITDLKETELALKESEERYRSLFENSPVALWEEDLTDMFAYLEVLKKKANGVSVRAYLDAHPNEIEQLLQRIRILRVNKAAIELHHAQSQEEVIRNLPRFFTEDFYEVFKDEMEALAKGETIFTCEERIRTLDGQVKYIYLKLLLKPPQKQTSSKYIGIIATTDITGLKNAEQEIRRSHARLKLLHELDKAVLEARSISEISQAVLKELHAFIPAERLSILILTEYPDRGIVYSKGLLQRTIGKGKAIKIDKTLNEWHKLRLNEVVKIDNLNLTKTYVGVKAVLAQKGIKSILNIPLMAHGELLGSLNLASKKPHAFSDFDIQITREVANSIAIAIEQTRLHEAIEQHALALEDSLHELQQIYDLSLSLAEAQTARQVAQKTTVILNKALVPDAVFFFIRKGNKLDLLAHHFNKMPLKISALRQNKLGQCICGQAAKLGKTIFSKNITKDKRCTLPACKKSGLRSVAAIPLIVGNQMLGVIGLGSLNEREFANQKSFIETLANEAALGLQNALLLEELRSHESELEERIARRTAELLEANKELESFSYSVSHDLRAPLRAIDGFSRILAEDYANKLDDEAKRLIGIVRKNTQQMGQLIDDLLAFSRTSRQIMNPSQINMTDLAKAIYYELTDAQQRKRIQFKLNALPEAHADATLMRQVWNNLLSNALKFTRTKAKPFIEIGFYVRSGYLVYFVKDNGVGFDMKYADKLFQIFQRLHSMEEFEGTGVGLSIVQRIIKRHGGRVWAESEPDKGATFYFSLPK